MGAPRSLRHLPRVQPKRQQLKDITHIKEPASAHMDIEITESDLTEKKLFFCTDFAVVKA